MMNRGIVGSSDPRLHPTPHVAHHAPPIPLPSRVHEDHLSVSVPPGPMTHAACRAPLPSRPIPLPPQWHRMDDSWMTYAYASTGHLAIEDRHTE
eukprot:11162844-Alexandrium_andersonii.AAC.1